MAEILANVPEQGQPQRLGFLAGCADRRFWDDQVWDDQVIEFCAKTGLEPNDFWLHLRAGGAASIVADGDFATADYAYDNGARIMGWGNHGNHCEGRLDEDDHLILDALSHAMWAVIQRYPEAAHLTLWSEPAAGGPLTVVNVFSNPSKLIDLERI
jgi:hypothetical protein